MPLIVVYNLSKKEYGAQTVGLIERTITKAVLDIPPLELTEDDISFSFPKDPTVTSAVVPVTIIVELLFDKPKRTYEVRKRLAKNIAYAFKQLPGNDDRTVEVAVKRFNPLKDGFYMIKKQ